VLTRSSAHVSHPHGGGGSAHVTVTGTGGGVGGVGPPDPDDCEENADNDDGDADASELLMGDSRSQRACKTTGVRQPSRLKTITALLLGSNGRNQSSFVVLQLIIKRDGN
jgi:hypothetical protein